MNENEMDTWVNKIAVNRIRLHEQVYRKANQFSRSPTKRTSN